MTKQFSLKKSKTNPVRDRRTYNPNLSINNFDLDESDLDKIFNAGDILGIGPQPLKVIIQHLEAIYCDAIGVEYMYIRSPEKRKWIQNWINENDNHPTFSSNQKKHILKKLVQAFSFENFLHTNFSNEGDVYYYDQWRSENFTVSDDTK